MGRGIYDEAATERAMARTSLSSRGATRAAQSHLIVELTPPRQEPSKSTSRALLDEIEALSRCPRRHTHRRCRCDPDRSGHLRRRHRCARGRARCASPRRPGRSAVRRPGGRRCAVPRHRRGPTHRHLRDALGDASDAASRMSSRRNSIVSAPSLHRRTSSSRTYPTSCERHSPVSTARRWPSTKEPSRIRRRPPS